MPDPQPTLEAFEALDQWVRQWETPADAQHVDPPGATGASVAIRLDGRLLGRGTVMSERGESLWLAARAAILEATTQLPIPEGANAQVLARGAASRMTIEYECAGSLTPLLGDSYEAAASVSPGRSGLAARLGERVEAIFPGTALMAGASPASSLRAAVGTLDLPPLALGQLRARHDLTVYRFEVRHVTRDHKGAAAQFLYRGGRIVSVAEVSRDRLARAAESMAQHLMTHRWPGDEPHGMLGDYLIHADTYDPILAGPRAQALAAFALARYHASDRAPDGAALEFATMLVQHAAVVTPNEPDPLAEASAAAMWLVARDEVERAGVSGLVIPQDFAEQAQARVAEAFDEDSGWNAETSAGERALLALALVRTGSAHADAAIGSLLRETDVGQLPALLPWLGWAEIERAGTEGQIPSGPLWRQERELVWEHQIDELRVEHHARDLVGGIVFTRGPNPLPSAQSLRPLAFLATALGDSRLTGPDEFESEVARLRPSLRFLLQLIPESRDCPRLPDCRRSVGGVRASVWEQRIPVEATALGLLVACETLESLGASEEGP